MGYPPIPPNASPMSIIQEYVIVKGERVKAHQIYCPKQYIKELEFDPTSPQAQLALAYCKKEIQKIKRYSRDIRRRQRKELGLDNDD